MGRVAARSHSPSPRLMSRTAFSCGLTSQLFMLLTPRRGSYLAPPAAVIISRAEFLRLALCFEDSVPRGCHELVLAAETGVARYVGISGLGTNPTNPWCQRPCRPPLQYKT